MMKGYLLNYFRFRRAIPTGFNTIDKVKMLAIFFLYAAYPASLLSLKVTGRLLNAWKIVSRYTFRYHNLQFACPGGISAMIGLRSSEPSVKSILEQNHDGDVVDVGANLGFYSVILSYMVDKNHKVLSVEPDPEYYEYLRSNISLNNCSNVIALQLACWSSETKLKLVRRKIGLALDSHVEEKSSDGSQTVLARRLDSILNEYGCHPSLIKIDVEGAEVEVLRGMRGILQEVRPTIVFEARAETIEKCGEILSKYGYKVRLLEDGNYLARPVDALDGGEKAVSVGPR